MSRRDRGSASSRNSLQSSGQSCTASRSPGRRDLLAPMHGGCGPLGLLVLLGDLFPGRRSACPGLSSLARSGPERGTERDAEELKSDAGEREGDIATGCVPAATPSRRNASQPSTADATHHVPTQIPAQAARTRPHSFKPSSYGSPSAPILRSDGPEERAPFRVQGLSSLGSWRSINRDGAKRSRTDQGLQR
jgi:hypothetical protein